MTSLTDRERFLTWMRVEQGRSDRTIEAYGRDIAQYESYLATAKSNSRVVKSAVIEKYVGQLRANERAPKSIARQFAAIRQACEPHAAAIVAQRRDVIVAHDMRAVQADESRLSLSVQHQRTAIHS